MKTKNIGEIRAMVFEEIESLRSGRSSPARINAITSALGLVLNTAKLELEWAKTLNKKPGMEFYEIEMEVEKKSLSNGE